MKRIPGYPGLLGNRMLTILLCLLGLSLFAAHASAQGGNGGNTAPGTGTVSMKGPSIHGGTLKGDGTVTFNTQYYRATSLISSLTISNFNLAGISDGANVYVTLEYQNLAIAPVFVGIITLAGGGGSLPLFNMVPLIIGEKLNTMSVRRADGSVILSGAITGL